MELWRIFKFYLLINRNLSSWQSAFAVWFSICDLLKSGQIKTGSVPIGIWMNITHPIMGVRTFALSPHFRQEAVHIWLHNRALCRGRMHQYSLNGPWSVEVCVVYDFAAVSFLVYHDWSSFVCQSTMGFSFLAMAGRAFFNTEHYLGLPTMIVLLKCMLNRTFLRFI